MFYRWIWMMYVRTGFESSPTVRFRNFDENGYKYLFHDNKFCVCKYRIFIPVYVNSNENQNVIHIENNIIKPIPCEIDEKLEEKICEVTIYRRTNI